MDEMKVMEHYARCNRRMRRYFDSYFTDTALTSVQAEVLHYIITKSVNNDVFPKDLEEHLDLKKPSVTSLLNYLENNGYIRREDVPYDGRYKKLVLTEKSKQVQEDVVKRISTYTELVFAGIPEKDMQVFVSVLQKMIDNM